MFVHINLKYFTHLSKMVFMKMKKRISSQIFHCFFIVKSRKCGVFLGLVFGSKLCLFRKWIGPPPFPLSLLFVLFCSLQLQNNSKAFLPSLSPESKLFSSFLLLNDCQNNFLARFSLSQRCHWIPRSDNFSF